MSIQFKRYVNVAETRELAELAFPDAEIHVAEHPMNYDGVQVVYVNGRHFHPFPEVNNEACWNDVHRVVAVLVERGLFVHWWDTVLSRYSLDKVTAFQDIEAWATAALEVLREANRWTGKDA